MISLLVTKADLRNNYDIDIDSYPLGMTAAQFIRRQQGVVLAYIAGYNYYQMKGVERLCESEKYLPKIQEAIQEQIFYVLTSGFDITTSSGVVLNEGRFNTVDRDKFYAYKIAPYVADLLLANGILYTGSDWRELDEE